jgi:hypothetical protein
MQWQLYFGGNKAIAWANTALVANTIIFGKNTVIHGAIFWANT